MKDNMQEIKKKFEDRCDEFKKQLAEFKNNNEAIEALKKQHKVEIAAHVQEHNTKFNKLLQEKLDSEDDLKEKAEKMKRDLNKELEQKLREAVARAKEVEQHEAEKKIK